jgi:hypothetical protein
VRLFILNYLAGPAKAPASRISDKSVSIKHIVGARQKQGRNRQTQSLRRTPVDHKLERAGLLDRQLRRPGAPEQTIHVVSKPTITLG